MSPRVATKTYFDRQLLNHSRDHDTLEPMLQSGLLAHHLPEVATMIHFGDDHQHKNLWRHTKIVVSQCPHHINLRWAALFHDTGKPATFCNDEGKISFHGHEAAGARIFQRVICPRTGWWDTDPTGAEQIRWLIHNSGRTYSENINDWTDSAVRRLITDCGPHLDLLIQFVRADITTSRQKRYQQHQRQLDELERRIASVKQRDRDQHPLPKGLGSALLIAYGSPRPGKWLGQEMDRLKQLVLTGQLLRDQPIEYYLKHRDINLPRA